MVYNVFTDGASRGNPGEAGIGFVIYDKNKIVFEYCEYLGKKTNSEAEYTAIIRAIEKLVELGQTEANMFMDSEFASKQLNGQYKVKSENIIPLYNQVLELKKSIKLNFHWVPREDNKKADELSNKGIDDFIKENSNLIINKAFFGKINCFKVQMNKDNDVYFHLGILKGQVWTWKKVKMSDIELGEIINLLGKEEAKCAFYHKFADSKTQIWCNRSKTGFSIKIDDVSKNLSIGELEVFKIILQKCIYLGI